MKHKKIYDNWYYFEKWKYFLRKFNFQKAIFIGSVGFEKRSLSTIKGLLNSENDIDFNSIKFIFFYLTSHSIIEKEIKNLELNLIKDDIEIEKEKNLEELKKIKESNDLDLEIYPFNRVDENEQFIGHEEIFHIVIKYLNENNYDNLFLDVSAFPRSTFIPLIRIFFDNSTIKNFFVVWTNKGGLTFEKNVVNYDQTMKLPLFSDFDPDSDDILFWLPILNFNINTIELVINQKNFKKNASYYPLATFPTNWLHETDKLIIENKDFFESKVFQIDKILYISYNNPFEFYLTIKKFYESKKLIFDINFFLIISPFGSKAQSIGSALAGILLERVSLLICRPIQYNNDINEPTEEELNKSYIGWIKGNF